MKKLSYFLFLGLSFVSCKSYQYTLFSSNLQQTTESHHFYYEDDSLYLDFDFSGQNFPISIYISNVSSKDLFLDLSQTLFQRNDQLVSTAIPPTKSKSDSQPSSDGIPIASGEEVVNPDLLFIPSGKSVILNYRIYYLPYDRHIRSQSKWDSIEVYGKKYAGKYLAVAEKNSTKYKISFRFANTSDFDAPWNVSTTFWPSLIFTSNTSPSYFPIKGPAVCYTGITTNYGKASSELFWVTLDATLTILAEEALK